jgi:hypothetical protein
MYDLFSAICFSGIMWHESMQKKTDKQRPPGEMPTEMLPQWSVGTTGGKIQA